VHTTIPFYSTSNGYKNLSLEDDSVTSTLGLKYDQRSVFLFSVLPQKKSEIVSKRSILSVSSSLFDPLGLVTPVIKGAKIILQELWIWRVYWDESVPQNIYWAWLSFLSSMFSLQSLRILRYCRSPDMTSLQLHGFCDASIRAVAYMHESSVQKLYMNVIGAFANKNPTTYLWCYSLLLNYY